MSGWQARNGKDRAPFKLSGDAAVINSKKSDSARMERLATAMLHEGNTCPRLWRYPTFSTVLSDNLPEHMLRCPMVFCALPGSPPVARLCRFALSIPAPSDRLAAGIRPHILCMARNDLGNLCSTVYKSRYKSQKNFPDSTIAASILYQAEVPPGWQPTTSTPNFMRRP